MMPSYSCLPDGDVVLVGRACSGMDTGHATTALCASRDVVGDRENVLGTPCRAACDPNLRSYHRRSISERGGCFQRRMFVTLSVCLSTR